MSFYINKKLLLFIDTEVLGYPEEIFHIFDLTNLKKGTYVYDSSLVHDEDHLTSQYNHKGIDSTIYYFEISTKNLSKIFDILRIEKFAKRDFQISTAQLIKSNEQKISECKDDLNDPYFSKDEIDSISDNIVHLENLNSKIKKLNFDSFRDAIKSSLIDYPSDERGFENLIYDQYIGLVLSETSDYPGLFDEFGNDELGDSIYQDTDGLFLFYKLYFLTYPYLRQDHMIQFDLTPPIIALKLNGDNFIKARSKEVQIEKTIILTEGTSDKFAIEKSLKLLYPELVRYFHFFEIENTRGGSTFIAELINGFIAANIKAQIIAIFDNDTSAQESIQNIQSIPDNLRIMHLPSTRLTSSYPTLGPNGLQNMNIEGKAVSIELFYGKDILTENDTLRPIQWMGFSSKLNQYQGEIIEKRKLGKEFRKKINQYAYADPSTFILDEMKVLIDSIISLEK